MLSPLYDRPLIKDVLKILNQRESKALKGKITSRTKDPLGTMMLDYMAGDHDASVKVTSHNLDMWKMQGRTIVPSDCWHGT